MKKLVDVEGSKRDWATLKEALNEKVGRRHVWFVRRTLLVRTKSSAQTCAEPGSQQVRQSASPQAQKLLVEQRALTEACWVSKLTTRVFRFSRVLTKFVYQQGLDRVWEII